MALDVSDSWNVTSYNLVNTCRRFSVKFCPPCRAQQWIFSLETETHKSFRLPVLFNQTIRYHISEDNIIAAKRRASEGGFGPHSKGGRAREKLRKQTSPKRNLHYDRSCQDKIQLPETYPFCYVTTTKSAGKLYPTIPCNNPESDTG